MNINLILGNSGFVTDFDGMDKLVSKILNKFILKLNKILFQNIINYL